MSKSCRVKQIPQHHRCPQSVGTRDCPSPIPTWRNWRTEPKHDHWQRQRKCASGEGDSDGFECLRDYIWQWNSPSDEWCKEYCRGHERMQNPRKMLLTLLTAVMKHVTTRKNTWTSKKMKYTIEETSSNEWRQKTRTGDLKMLCSACGCIPVISRGKTSSPIYSSK